MDMAVLGVGMKLIKFFRENKPFFIILLVFVLFYFLLLIKFDQLNDVWWDAAAYIGMGKYIFSGGQIGFFEYGKSALLPLILGLFWKCGLDVVFWGKILIFLSAIFSIFFLYLITKDFFTNKTGILACIILSSNVLFFLFVFRIYTEILSILFFLASLFFMIKFSKEDKKILLILCALFCILAFLVKYTNVFGIIILEIFLIYHEIKKKRIINIFIFNLFLLVFILPYLIVNYYFGKDILYLFKVYQNSFKDQIGKLYGLKSFPGIPRLIFKNTDWLYFKSILYLFNFILPFLFYGIYLLFRDRKNKDYFKRILLIFIPAMIIFIFFEINSLKQERYLLPIFPLIAILIAHGMLKSKISPKIKLGLLFCYLLISLCLAIPFITNQDERSYSTFFSNPYENLTCQRVATSDPRVILNDNIVKIVIPYEIYDKTWTNATIVQSNPDCIYYYSCYENGTTILHNILELNYSTFKLKNNGRCIYAILEK